MKSVLLVDDEYIFRNALRQMLDWEALGLRIVAEAENGRDALQVLQDHAVDIIITDIKMPVLDGIELAGSVAAQYPNTRVIALSGYDEYDLVRKAFVSGVSDYIIKNDLSSEQVFTTIQKIVKESVVSDLFAGREYWLDERVVPLLVPSPLPDHFYLCMIKSEHQKIPERAFNWIRKPLSFIQMNPDMILLLVPKERSADALERFLSRLFYHKLHDMKDIDLVMTVSGPACAFMQALRQCLYAMDQEYTEGTGIIHVFDGDRSERLNPSVSERLGRFMQWLQDPASFDPNVADKLLVTPEEARSKKPRDIAEYYSGLIRIIADKSAEKGAKNTFGLSPQNKDVRTINEKVRRYLKDAQNEAFANPYIARSVAEYIQMTYKDKPSLSKLAKKMNLSAEHLSREIVRSFGQSFTQLIQSKRVDQSDKLIRDTNLKIYEISQAVGYGSYKQFSEAFKKRYGISPHKYQQMVRKTDSEMDHE